MVIPLSIFIFYFFLFHITHLSMRTTKLSYWSIYLFIHSL